MHPQIHTFTLTYPISGYEYYLCKNQFFEMARGLPRCCYEKAGSIIFNYWACSGVIVSLEMLHGNYNGGVIHFKINPSTLIGEYSPFALYSPNQDSCILSGKLKEILGVLPIGIRVEALLLSRIDICIDCLIDKQKTLEAYIKILKKGTQSDIWEQKTFEDDRDTYSFRRAGNRYQLTVYDKRYEVSRRRQIDCSGDSGMLRIEAALLTKGIHHMINKYALNDSGWERTVCEIFKAGEEILCDVLCKMLPQGDYYAIKDAEKIIMNSEYNRNKKEALLTFLKDINRKHRVNLLEVRTLKNGKKRLLQLRKLGINPVLIGAGQVGLLPGTENLIRALCVTV